jgi:signal transduction histidine kinase
MNAELERFASVAAHDLKSPLNSITQFIELLKESLGGKIGPDEAELLRFITNSGVRLRSLIDDLLAYARSGKNLGEIKSVDLQTLVEEVISALHGSLSKTGALMDVGPLPLVSVDRVGISQVFQNLISNAVKYRREQPLRIKVRAFDQGDSWRFEISDNGLGIRDEDQSSAFELFKRFEVSSDREGTGLGLPICKRVIEAHGGSIWLESKKGAGTTIRFTLPKIQPR